MSSLFRHSPLFQAESPCFHCITLLNVVNLFQSSFSGFFFKIDLKNLLEIVVVSLDG